MVGEEPELGGFGYYMLKKREVKVREMFASLLKEPGVNSPPLIVWRFRGYS